MIDSIVPLFTGADEDEVTARPRVVDPRRCFCQNGRAVPRTERSKNPTTIWSSMPRVRLISRLHIRTERCGSTPLGFTMIFFRTGRHLDQVAAFTSTHEDQISRASC